MLDINVQYDKFQQITFDRVIKLLVFLKITWSEH